MRNGVQLITYPDSLGKNLNELSSVLQTFFQDAFTGIHILPFFPSSADRGFAPLEYETIDPAFGTWEDITDLSRSYDLQIDFMVNHLSRRSPQFLDYQARGAESPWKELFLEITRLYPEGAIPPEELKAIYTRKPRSPETIVLHPDGRSERLWCTFGEEQIDLDVTSETGWKFIEQNIRGLCNRGISTLRLDAFAYVIKKRKTSCFFVEPEIWDLLGRIRDIANEYGVAVLPEIHEHYSLQLKLAEHGYRVYDFALPMLLLHTVFTGNTRRLKDWLSRCPEDQITTLDTHDGIGIVDAADLLTQEEITETVETLYRRGSNVNRRYSSAEYNNLDIYQINCTYYSALGEDDNAYILCRAIQFFCPGIPQVYYVGALSGRNDLPLVEKTKNGRDINRHAYTRREIEEALSRPVNRRLLRLLRFRSAFAAFNGSFEILDSPDNTLYIRRAAPTGEEAFLKADLAAMSCEIRFRSPGQTGDAFLC